MKIISVLLACGFIGFAAMLGFDVELLFDAPCLVIVGGITIFLTSAQHSMSDIRAAFGAAFGAGAETRDIPKHMAVFTTIRVVAVGSGLVGTLIGLVNMLASLDDPNSIGPALAVATLTTLYGVIISEVIVAPLSGGLIRPVVAEGEGQSVGWTIVGLLGAFLLVLLGILLGGQIALFIDVASLCLVFGVSLCLVFGQYSMAEVISTLGAGFRRRPLTAAVAETHGHALRTIRGIFHAGGAVGFLVSLVLMLASMEDPKQVGPAMAIGLLSPFYALLMAEFLLAPMLLGLPARVTDPENLKLERTQISFMPVGFFFLGAMIAFFVLMMSFK